MLAHGEWVNVVIDFTGKAGKDVAALVAVGGYNAGNAVDNADSLGAFGAFHVSTLPVTGGLGERISTSTVTVYNYAAEGTS